MIGTRTRYSLAQFLELQEPMMSVVLLSKYGVQHLSLPQSHLLFGLLNTLRGLDDRLLLLVLAEIVATQGDLRARVNPKYRFDERMHDLTQCLLLDEPDNHLDLPSQQALQALLREYPGTLIIVSHDETMLQALKLTHRLNFANTCWELKIL